jgi:hypothetical protein
MDLVKPSLEHFGQAFAFDSDFGRMDLASAEEFEEGNRPLFLILFFDCQLAEQYVVMRTSVSTGLPVAMAVSLRFES